MGVSGKSSTTSGERQAAAKAFQKMVGDAQKSPGGRRKRKGAKHEARRATVSRTPKKRKGSSRRKRVREPAS